MLEECFQFSPGELRLKLDFFLPPPPFIPPSNSIFVRMSCSVYMLSFLSFSVLFAVILNCTLVSDHREQTRLKTKTTQNKQKTPTKTQQNTQKKLYLEALSCHSSGLCEQCGLIFGCVFFPLFYHPHLGDLLFSCMMCVSVTLPHTGMKMALCGFGMHLVFAYTSFIS